MPSWCTPVLCAGEFTSARYENTILTAKSNRKIALERLFSAFFRILRNLVVVAHAIDFYDQTRAVAVEVHHIGPDRMLPAELQAADLAERLPPVCVLLGITGTFLFINRALAIAELSPRLSWAMKIGALLCAGAALLVVSNGLRMLRGGR